MGRFLHSRGIAAVCVSHANDAQIAAKSTHTGQQQKPKIPIMITSMDNEPAMRRQQQLNLPSSQQHTAEKLPHHIVELDRSPPSGEATKGDTGDRHWAVERFITANSAAPPPPIPVLPTSSDSADTAPNPHYHHNSISKTHFMQFV